MSRNAISSSERTTAGLHEPFLERASRGDSHASRAALGAFLTMRLIDRVVGTDGADQSQAFSYQLAATRNFVDDLNPRTVEVNHLRGILDIAEHAQVAGERDDLWPPLLAYAYWLEHELRLGEALDVLDSTMPLGESQESVGAHLQRARILRVSGAFEEARLEYSKGGELARQCGDTHAELLSRIGIGTLLRQSGNLPESRRAFSEVVSDARRLNDRDAEARACHDLSVTLSVAGRPAEAVPWAFHAFQLYDESLQRIRALSDTGLYLKELGNYAAARHAFAVVLASDVPPEIRARTVLEVLDLSALMGDRISFQRARAELSERYDQLPPEEQADFELKLGIGLCEFGRPEQGEAHVQKAIQLAEQYGFGERIFRGETALRRIRERQPLERPALADDQAQPGELVATIERLQTLETV